MTAWRYFGAGLLVGLLGVAALPNAAEAHPHVLVDALEQLVFDEHGDLAGIASVWSFDDAFSAYAVQGYDSAGDGRPTREDLQPLAQTNIKSLGVYHFFTSVLADGKEIGIGEPKDFWDEFANEKLILHFTLPLQHPLQVAGHAVAVEVFDPDYFAAVSFPPAQATSFPGEPPGCKGTLQRPEPLDGSTASKLAEIPANQRELPPNLRAITDRLVNAIVLQCR